MRRFHTVAWSTTAPNATLFAVTVTLLAGLAITLTPGVSDAVFQSMDAEPTGAASVAPTRPNLVVSGIGPSGQDGVLFRAVPPQSGPPAPPLAMYPIDIRGTDSPTSGRRVMSSTTKSGETMRWPRRSSSETPSTASRSIARR